MSSILTYLEDFPGVVRLTENLLHVSSHQKDGGHHPHQHPGEDEAESDATVEDRCQWTHAHHSLEQRQTRWQKATLRLTP